MINLNNTTLRNCIIHKVGNKIKDEDLILSKNELDLKEELQLQLNEYFLRQFKVQSETYKFHHDIDLKMNEVFASVDNLFEKENFIKNTSNIAKHLYEQTRHPAIKSGELFIALFDEIIYDDTICKGVGIFKSERKDNFFKVREREKKIELIIDTGISQQKLDKGCLILNDDFHEGFKVFTYEHNNADTDYWRNDFLNIKIKKDNYFQTKSFLSACKDFVTERLPEEFKISKADQIDYLNRSIDYFKKNEQFDEREFSKRVFVENDVIKSFKTFKQDYQDEKEIKFKNEFSISSPAVKKQSKNFKSVLKLDKNFHIYIHGNRDMIQKGIEKDGRKYYKIYYNEEI